MQQNTQNTSHLLGTLIITGTYGTAQFKLDYTRMRQLYDSTCF